ASDICCRVFAESAAPILGQQFVPENKPGAGSSIAAQYVARAAPDGYTVFVPALSTLTNELANPSPAFDMSKDFAAVALLAHLAIVLVGDPAPHRRHPPPLIAFAEAKPAQGVYAPVRPGRPPHLCGVMLAQRAGLDLVHVPYPGSPQGVLDVVAGRITMMFAPASGIIGQVAAGKLTALATAADKRPVALPDVPTMAEAGMPDFDTSLWLGLLAPAGPARPDVGKPPPPPPQATPAARAGGGGDAAQAGLRAARRRAGRVFRRHPQRDHPLVRDRARGYAQLDVGWAKPTGGRRAHHNHVSNKYSGGHGRSATLAHPTMLITG